MSADRRPIIGRSSLYSKLIGDDRPIVQFCDFLSKSVRIVFNVIASVSRQIDVYRPIKIPKSYRPTVSFNVIAALSADKSADCRPTVGGVNVIAVLYCFSLMLADHMVFLYQVISSFI